MIHSIVNTDIIEAGELNEKADKAEKSEDAATTIKQYEEIICTKKKNIVYIVYHQGKVFRGFKEKENIMKLVNEKEGTPEYCYI